MSNTTQPQDHSYASFWQRLMAHLCDRLILSIIPLLGFFYLIQAKDLPDFFYRIIVAIFLIYLPSLLFNIFYFTWFVSNSGATPGKQIWGLKIVDEDGKYLSPWMAFFREQVTKQISSVVFCLGFLWMIKEKDHLTWHDMFAGSYVIKSDHSWNSLLITLLLVIAVVLIIFALSSEFPEFTTIFSSILNKSVV